MKINRMGWFVTLVGGLALGLLQGCAPLIVAGGAGAAAVAVDRRTTGSVVDDEAIELKATNAIYSDQATADQAHIVVTSYNGVVLLTGQAPTEAMRDHAVEQTRSIEKVRSVHNEITLGETLSSGDRAHDAWLTTKIKTQLLTTKGVNVMHVKVVTENTVTYLMGVLGHAESDVASDVASHVDGVTRVVKLIEYID